MFSKLLKSIFIYGIAGSISSLIGFILLPIYTRAFSPAEYGVIELINTIISFISILGMLQLESAISRFFYEVSDEEKGELVSTAFWSIIMLSFIAGGLLILTSRFFAIKILQDETLFSVLNLAAIIIPLTNIYLFFSVIMRFLKKPLIFIVFMSIQLVSTLGFAIYFVLYLKSGLVGAFYGKIIGLLCTDIAMIIYLKKYLHFNVSLSRLKEMLKYSLPLVPATGGAWINSYASRVIMVAYLNMSEIGLYSVAFKVASLFTLIERAFKMAWQPFMWETYKREDHKAIFKRIANYVLIIAFAIILVITLFSKEITYIFTSVDYAEAYNLVGFILLAFGLRMINQIFGMGPGISKKTQYNTISFFISVGVHLLCLFIILPRFGLIAVPVSLFVANLTLNLISWGISEKLYFVGFNKGLYIIVLGIALSMTIIMSIVSINLHYKFIIAFLFVILALLVFLFRVKKMGLQYGKEKN